MDEDLIAATQEVLAQFPKLVMARKVAYAADPFVIALAKLNGSTVLTEEGFGSPGKPKIPLVCQSFGLPCCNILDLIRARRWIIG